MTRVAGFADSSEYRHSDGLYYDGSFTIGGSGPTSLEHVWLLSDTGQLVWHSQAHFDWFEQSFPRAAVGGLPPVDSPDPAAGRDSQLGDDGDQLEVRESVECPSVADAVAIDPPATGLQRRRHMPRWLGWTLFTLALVAVIFAFSGLNGLICTGTLALLIVMSLAAQKRTTREQSSMVCPHCQTRGTVRTKPVTQKKGVSGGKATAAVLTGGVSLLATGLSRKEQNTEAHCSRCGAKWYF